MKRLCMILLLPVWLKAQVNVDSITAFYQTNRTVPAVGVGIISKGQLIKNLNIGERIINIAVTAADSNTIYSIGSVNKLVTTTAILTLVRDNKVGLDDDISSLLGYTIENLGYQNTPITIRHLLTHQSSIRDETDTLATYINDCSQRTDLDTIVYHYLKPGGRQFNIGSFYIYEPGTSYEYANMNFIVLGAIVEAVADTTFEDYCRKEIFEPLCMNNSYWRVDEVPDSQYAYPHTNVGRSIAVLDKYCLDIYPSGQLSTTLEDFARFTRTYVKGSSPILPDSLIDAALTPYYFNNLVGIDQGLGWYSFSYLGKTWWGHNGGITGVNSNFYWNIDDDEGIIVFENRDTFNEDLIFDLIDQAGVFNGNGPAINCHTIGVGQRPLGTRDIEVYPNPVNDHLMIEVASSELLEVAVYNNNGQLINTFTTKDGTLYNTSNLPRGLYYLKVNGTNAVKRFIKP